MHSPNSPPPSTLGADALSLEVNIFITDSFLQKFVQHLA